MTFGTAEGVFFAISFLVPGFIWSATVSLFLTRRPQTTYSTLLGFLTLSCINYGIWSWALFLVASSGLLRTRPGLSAGLLFSVVFVSPVLLGCLSAWLAQKNTVARFLYRLGFRALHPIPTAWDYRFSSFDPAWVIVTLRDGSRVHGFLGARSFAGEAAVERDLYLDAVYRVNAAGQWELAEGFEGIWIAASAILTIEFIRVKKEVCNAETETTE